MYLYPMYFSDELIDTIAGSRADRAVSRHAAAAHQRHDAQADAAPREPRATPSRCSASSARAIPNLVMRTTFITGFPGETDEQFDELVEFVARAAVRAAGRVHLFVRARHAGRQAAGPRAGRSEERPPRPADGRAAGDRLRLERRARSAGSSTCSSTRPCPARRTPGSAARTPTPPTSTASSTSRARSLRPAQIVPCEIVGQSESMI